jgi:hypothetical protein
MTPEYLTMQIVLAITGSVALLAGLFGGGVKAKEIEIPKIRYQGSFRAWDGVDCNGDQASRYHSSHSNGSWVHGIHFKFCS